MFGVTDKKRGVGDVVFLSEFLRKPLYQCGRSRRKEPQMEESVDFWIDSGVQLKLLVADSDHRLVECNVVRAGTVSRLWIGFLHPIMDGLP